MNRIQTQIFPTILMTITVGLIITGCEKVNWGGGGKATSDTEGAYTILLFTHEGADHIVDAKAHEERITKASGWDGLFVVDKEKTSSLYWGKYKNRKAAMKNLKKAKEFVSPTTGVKIYQRAMVVPLPGKDEGPPEWNLKNAPAGMKWSVKVGVYYDMPDRNYYGRKGEAVEVCRQLRERGEEGYYFHGPVRSGVFIGAFPPSSAYMRQVQSVQKKSGDESYKEDFIVNDPRIRRILKDYPDLVVCGAGETTKVYDPKTQQVKVFTQPSGVVIIPGREGL